MFEADNHAKKVLLASVTTGAGKMNIAMLIALGELWNNLDGGVICIDQFKFEQFLSL